MATVRKLRAIASRDFADARAVRTRALVLLPEPEGVPLDNGLGLSSVGEAVGVLTESNGTGVNDLMTWAKDSGEEESKSTSVTSMNIRGRSR